MEKQLKQSLNIAVIITISTIISTAVSFVYQQTYFHEYGVDITLFSPIIDPAQTLIAFLVILMAVYFFLWVSFLPRLIDFLSKRSWRVANSGLYYDVITLVIGVGYIIIGSSNYLKTITLFAKPGFSQLVLLVGFALALYPFMRLVFILKRMGFRFKGDSPMNSFSNRYRRVSESLSGHKLLNLFTLRQVYAGIICTIAIISLPVIFGLVVAHTQRAFTTANLKEIDKGHNVLVLGKTQEGLVTREYDTRSGKLLEGFKIIEVKNGRFSTTTLAKNPLN